MGLIAKGMVAAVLVVDLGACAVNSQSKLTDEEKLAQVEKYNETVAEEKQLVCTREKVMGSIRPQVTCRTKEQIAEEKLSAEEVTRRQRSLGSNPTVSE